MDREKSEEQETKARKEKREYQNETIKLNLDLNWRRQWSVNMNTNNW